MKFNIPISFFALMFLLVSSCTEPYTPELDETNTRLAIEGNVTDIEDGSFVRLTLSQPYLVNQRTVAVENASVSVVIHNEEQIVEGELVMFEESADSTGLYLPPQGFKGIPEKFYTLFVENVDVNDDGIMESYSATDYMVPPLPDDKYDSISVTYISVPQFDFWQIGLYAFEPKGPNWYIFQKLKNGVRLSDSIRLWNVTDDFLLDGNYATNVLIQQLSNQDSIEFPELGDTISMEMWNISEAYFDYCINVQQVIAYQNPLFSGPQANPYANVSEGSVGFFAAYSINTGSTIVHEIPDEAIERRDDEF